MTATTATTATTRADVTREAREGIFACVSKSEAIRWGLRIASTKMMSARDATADGCVRAADAVADGLERLYLDSTTLQHRLARLVARRDWASLWAAARREVYPSICA